MITTESSAPTHHREGPPSVRGLRRARRQHQRRDRLPRRARGARDGPLLPRPLPPGDSLGQGGRPLRRRPLSPQPLRGYPMSDKARGPPAPGKVLD
jgi:hypothetical protein